VTVAESDENKELVFTRIFAAPRTRVWQAWTDPKQLALWWGPKDFTNLVCEFDARPGGAIRIDIRAPDGIVYTMTGTVREIVPPSQFVFSGEPLEGGKPLFQGLTTVTLEEKGEQTVQTVRARVLNVMAGKAADYLKGMQEGWNRNLDRLADRIAET
jgi:uncharacterized protein YndB with AHSA1/START domain